MRHLLIALAFTLAACSNEQPAATATAEAAKPKAVQTPPTTQQAREIIEKSAELSEHRFTSAGWTAPMTVSMMSAPVRDEAKQLEAAGWIKLGKEIELTEKTGGDKRFNVRLNGLIDIVPIAKKEMGDVASVTPNSDGTLSAPFQWKWVPNEVGAAFQSGPTHDRLAAPQESKATFLWDGEAWTVLKIE
jgi:hypothetical protein